MLRYSKDKSFLCACFYLKKKESPLWMSCNCHVKFYLSPSVLLNGGDRGSVGRVVT